MKERAEAAETENAKFKASDPFPPIMLGSTPAPFEPLFDEPINSVREGAGLEPVQEAGAMQARKEAAKKEAAQAFYDGTFGFSLDQATMVVDIVAGGKIPHLDFTY